MDQKSGEKWVKKGQKREANSIQCSQAVTHPSTDWTQHCLTSVIGRELVYSMWYGRWHLRGTNSHFFNLSHHYRKGRWNLKTGLKTQFPFRFCLLLPQGKRDWKTLNLSHSNANGHITLNTPVLVRSLKLSNVESSQYLDGWPPGNTGCCWLLSFYSFLANFSMKESLNFFIKLANLLTCKHFRDFGLSRWNPSKTSKTFEKPIFVRG